MRRMEKGAAPPSPAPSPAPAGLAGLIRAFARDERANIAIMGAIMLPMLVGGMALGTEAGFWYAEQRELQHAADTASHAAGIQLRAGGTQAQLEETALDIASASGFDAAIGALTVNAPPLTGPRAGLPDNVEVLLERRQPRYFTKIYADDDVTIAVRAVAGLGGGSTACLLALSGAAPGAVTVSGSSEVRFTGCDIATNSTASNAFLMNGGAVEVTAGCIHSVGGVSTTSNLTMTTCAAPNTQAPRSRDPYADIPEPANVGTCQPSSIGSNNSTTGVTPIENHPSGVTSMRFCGGLDLRGTVNLDPGLYIVDGGTLRINSTTTLNGDGVTFYLTNGAELAINGSASIDLSAPTAGPFSGVLIFGNRADTGVTHQINGNASSSMDGAVYTPASSVAYSGNFGGGNGCTQLVVDTIVFTGNSELAVDCQAAGTRPALVNQQVTVVE